MTEICAICGFIKATPQQGMGYAGNICIGHETPQQKALTRDELREIVREEIAKARNDVLKLMDTPSLETSVQHGTEEQ